MRRSWRRRAWYGAFSLALLTGCVGLPASGPVHEGLERAPEPEGIVFLAPDPPPGGDPLEIINGFLDAATAGVADRYETAQKYLTDGARTTWVPGAGVTIYAGSASPEVEERSGGRILVKVPVAGYVDERGIYSEEPPDTTKTFRFQLTRVQGQWRISDLNDGVLISTVNFGTQYRQVPLAFFGADGEHTIPDPRWFPEQNAASFAVNALLEGPADWLLPGVVTAIPPGTSADPVGVSEGTAEVSLSQGALSASPADREMIVSQLEHTLTQLPQVRRVRTLVDDIPFTDGGAELDPAEEPPMSHTPVVLQDEGVSTASASGIAPLDAWEVPKKANYTALAIPYGDVESGGLPIVVRSGGQAIEALAGEGNPGEVLMEGEDLLAPSYDRFGWVWSGPAASNGTLMVTRPESGVVSVVSAPALAEHEVRAIHVARDGARLAFIQVDGDDVMIQVAVILREEDGTPASISDPITVGRSVADSTDVAWVDSVTLAVLGTSDGGAPSVHITPLGGPSVALLAVPDATSLASGRGEQELWVATEDGQLFNRAGNGWRRVGEELDVRAVAFSG